MEMLCQSWSPDVSIEPVVLLPLVTLPVVDVVAV